MAKPELGLKRTCVDCGARFYDLNAVPPVCPKCGVTQPGNLSRLKRRDDDLPDDKAKTLPDDEHEDNVDVDLDTAEDTDDDVIDDDDDISNDIEVTTDKDERDDN